MSRIRRRLGNTALTVGAVLGAGCLLLVVLGPVVGLRPLLFRSGSMAPTIATGDIALSRHVLAGDLAVGDIVSVPRPDGARVTHRITELRAEGDRAALTLRGDANEAVDPEEYVVTGADRVLFVVPWIGRLVVGVANFPVLLGLALAAVGWVATAQPASGRHRTVPGRRRAARGRRRESRGRGAVVATATVALVAAPVLDAVPAEAAPWVDDVSVTGTTLTAYTVPKPGWASCTISGGALLQKTATIVWNEVSAPYPLDYRASIVQTGQTMTVTDNGATRQTQFSAGLLSVVLNQTYTVRIQAELPAPNGTWRSVVLEQPITVALLGLGLSCGTPN